jgi:hypothetical protein
MEPARHNLSYSNRLPTEFPARLRAVGAALLAALMLLCASPLLTACTANSYAGIPFSVGAADPDLQGLAMRAQAGDKHAQLELGVRYEEGRGVPIDLRRAERLYLMAASDSGGTTYVYSPPVGRNGRGQVIPVDTGPRQHGLPEARVRLDELQGVSSERPNQSMSASTVIDPAINGIRGNRETWRAIFDQFVSAAQERSPREASVALWSALEPDRATPLPPNPRKQIQTTDGNIEIMSGLAECRPFAPAWAQEICRAHGDYLEMKMSFADTTSRNPGCLTNEEVLQALIEDGWVLPQVQARAMPNEDSVPVITNDLGMRLEDVLNYRSHLFVAIRPSADLIRICHFTLTAFVF